MLLFILQLVENRPTAQLNLWQKCDCVLLSLSTINFSIHYRLSQSLFHIHVSRFPALMSDKL